MIDDMTARSGENLIEERPPSKLQLELEESELDLLDEDTHFNTRRSACFVGRDLSFLR
jgi:hypothetical protein